MIALLNIRISEHQVAVGVGNNMIFVIVTIVSNIVAESRYK